MGGIVVAVMLSAFFFAWAGHEVGEPKGRGTQGLLIGLLFSLAGVATVYMLPPSASAESAESARRRSAQRKEDLPAKGPERLRAMYNLDLISEAEYLKRGSLPENRRD